MTQFNFDVLPERIGTNCTKWDHCANRFGHEYSDPLIPLWIADMDFKTPPEIIEALQKRIEKGVFGYTSLSEDFGTAVSGWLKKRHQVDVDHTWIRFTPGVMPGISNIIRAFSKAGDGVIIQPPVYYPFFSVVTDAERKLVFNLLIEDGMTYKIDFEDLEEKAKRPDTKIMIVCNPHNPVGRVWTRAELQKMGQICLDHQVLMIVDEIHADIVYKPYVHQCFLGMPSPLRDNSFVMISPSKSFNLAGLQTAAVIIPDASKSGIYRQFSEKAKTNGVNCLGELALVTAYTQCEYYVDQLLDYLEENRLFIENFLRCELPDIMPYRSEGTYLMWLDLRKSGVDLGEIESFILKKAHLAVDFGSWFGENGNGFIRVNYACPKYFLEMALINLKIAHSQKTE